MKVAEGLTASEAARLLAEAGPNLLPAERTVPQWRKLWGEMTHFFALMLWCAAGLAFIGNMPELAVAIIVVVLVNGVFAHIQQERAQHAAAKLRGLLPADVMVRRDGSLRRVHAAELVPGDRVVLAAGDRIPADAVFATSSQPPAPPSQPWSWASWRTPSPAAAPPYRHGGRGGGPTRSWYGRSARNWWCWQCAFTFRRSRGSWARHRPRRRECFSPRELFRRSC